MSRSRRLLAFALLGLVAVAAAPRIAAAQETETPPPPRQSWSFSGPFGTFDRAQLQRGFKVYREVCSNCHSLELLSFRNLAEPGGPGFTEAQAAAIAAEYKIQDGPNDQGEMFERNGRVADHFPRSFPNEQAARLANGGAAPQDMSVLAKAREYERGFPWFVFDIFTQFEEQEGPDYIAAIPTGYVDAPKDFELPEGSYYNKYFPARSIKMPPPIQAGQVAYTDGTPTTVEQYGRDVAAFLEWTAEPKLEARKRIGFQVLVFLVVLAGLLYLTKKKVWKEVELHPEDLAPRPPTEYSKTP
jgi:cytochrome c1